MGEAVREGVNIKEGSNDGELCNFEVECAVNEDVGENRHDEEEFLIEVKGSRNDDIELEKAKENMKAFEALKFKG